MSFNFGIQNVPGFQKAKVWLKYSLGVYSNGKVPVDDSIDNNYQNYADNASGIGAMATFKELNASNQFQVNAGHMLVDTALTINQPAVPNTPTAATNGTAGSTTNIYKIVGRAGSMQCPSTGVTIATCAATLTATNSVTITWIPVPGYAVFDVYRTTAAGTPSTTGRIGTVSAGFQNPNITSGTMSFTDTGLTADGSTVPATNTTGALVGDLNVYGNLNLNALATPHAALATVVGTAGATSNVYKIVARCGSTLVPTGHTVASAGVTVTTCNATLSASNYVKLVWQPVVGATSYDVYRTTSGGTPSTTGLIGNTVATTGFNDTGLAGDSASAPVTNTTGVSSLPNSTTAALAAITDTNGNPEIIFTATTSAVNGLTETNSATGNPVALAASGSDTDIGLTITSKGAGALTLTPGSDVAGTVLVGTTTQTGTITVGRSTAANTVSIASGNPSSATQTVNIGNGAAATSGGVTINLGAGIPGASTANTLNLGSGGTTTGTVAVNLGSNGNAAHVTTIKGGSGSAIALTPQTTGTIVIGAAAGTGAITVGSSSTTQSVLVGNGAGVATVSIANAGIAGNTVNITGAATGGSAVDTVNIATGNAATTAAKKVNIATGTPNTTGNNQVIIGGGATSSVTINAAASSYTAVNWQVTEGGANNAITANFVDAAGGSLTLAAGLRVLLKLAHSLQAGANTLAINGGSTKAIKKHTNPANDIGTAYVSGSIVDLTYDGTQWQDMSQ